MIYDISPVIDAELRVWPGDVPPTREIQSDIARGDLVTQSVLRTTVHVGAHVDAPSHYGVTGATIDRCEVDAFIGPCQVIRVDVEPGQALQPADVRTTLLADRVLFATGTYPDPREFREDFAALSPELLDVLAANRVRLVGIDTPSVDLFRADGLPVHRRAFEHGMLLLEGIRLEAVPDGLHELIALPLRLAGFDGSPVRAVLRSEHA